MDGDAPLSGLRCVSEVVKDGNQNEGGRWEVFNARLECQIDEVGITELGQVSIKKV